MKVKIDKYDHNGRGIGYIDNMVVFVDKAVVGDVLEIKITKKRKNYWEGKIVKIIDASSKRRESICPYFYKCGGCDFLNIDYVDSLEYKKDKVKNVLKKVNVDIAPIVVLNEVPLNYRNKVSLKFVNGKLGFYEAKSHKVVAIDKCLISKEAINKAIEVVKTFKIIDGEVVIRCNFNDVILLIINTKDKFDLDIDAIKESIKLVGIVLNDECIYGDSYFVDKVNDIFYQVSYDSFFQVNHFMAEKLGLIISDLVDSDDSVLDLYCGVGMLSLFAARKAKRVLGVEIIPNAVLNAIKNAQINNFSNAKFVLNDAGEAIDKIKDKFETIIVDPPRKGLDDKTIKSILKMMPSKMIYVSCDTLTLVRDLEKLLEMYEVKKLYILDMFSYCYHVECVCLLERK